MQEYYSQPQSRTRYAIERAANNLFFINYSIDKDGRAACTSGPFVTIEAARATLQKHRPGVILLNSMCGKCATFGADCNGTDCQAWTGCIYFTR